MSKINVLITSPSINVNNNVSGIANLTNLWIQNNHNVNYILFEAGKKDKTQRGLIWIFFQIFVLLRFMKTLYFNKINIVHINLPLEYLSIIREYFFIKITSFFDIPIVVHLRGGKYNLINKLPMILNHCLEVSMKLASKIIVLGKLEKEFFIEKNVSPNKIFILPNSVNPSNIFKFKDISFSKEKNILFLGRLDRNKGLIEVIRSLSVLSKKKYFLQIAGDGPDKEWFLNECSLHFSNHFNYYGVLAGKEKDKLLKSSHFFLLPSYFEGLPNALLEAMGYGLVSIVTPVGSISEVITNRYNGILIPIKNHIKIIEEIMYIENNPTLYQSICQNAYNTIKSSYSINKSIEKLNSIYNEVIEIK